MIVVASRSGLLSASQRGHTLTSTAQRRASRPASERKRMVGEQPAQSVGIDPPPIQRGVKASPAATMRGLQTQVHRRRDSVSGEEGVGELEERIGATVEAFVEGLAKGAQDIGRFHNDPLCRWGQQAATSRSRSLSSWLKRKLRLYPKTAKLSKM
jgi:hypothetical protein